MRNLPRFLRIAVAVLSFSASALSFTFVSQYFANPWPDAQFGPGLVRMLSAFTATGLLAVAAWLAFAFVFGRFYCAAVCPLGVLQDAAGFFVRRKKRKPAQNHRRIRYAVALAAFGLLACGSATIFAALDPYSLFGRIAIGAINPSVIALQNAILYFRTQNQPLTDPLAIAVGSVLPLAIVIALVVWKKRIFCTALCPVGTLFGLCAGHGLARLHIDENKCLSCGKCMKACPAACPAGAIGWTVRCRQSAPVNLSRRDFLAGGAVVAAAAGLGCFLKHRKPSDFICPPGAGSTQRFLSRCTGCGLCVAACKGNVIRPANANARAIHLEFADGLCEFNCRRCTEVCPTGALTKMKLRAKQRLRIALAELTLDGCITVVDGTDCGACAEQCPTGALHMVTESDGRRIPAFAEGLCIGCGSCENACPVRPTRAVAVHPIPIQVQADDPKDYREPGKAVGPADGEWLF